MISTKNYLYMQFVLAATLMWSVNVALAQETSGANPADLPKDMNAVYGTPDRVSEDFKAHGIGKSEEELLGFLQKGLPRTSDLPSRPVEKSQLVIDAMALLAEMRSQAAVPVIIQIARFDTSLGAFRVVEYDVSKSSPHARDDFRVRAYRLIQYNAINALGLIGDHRATELIRSILQQEQAAGAQIQYSLCLASLGDPSGVGYLVNLISKKNRRDSAAAAKAFYYITGQDFGYTENSPVRAREALPAQYTQWWNQNKATFRVHPEAVRQRRLNSSTKDVYAARSTRDLLKLATNYFDFNNTLGSRDARQSLKDAGTNLNPELSRIALDPMEDLDVRSEAMNWYFEANRSDPLAILKKLARDENPEVADKATTIMGQIVDEARMRGGT